MIRKELTDIATAKKKPDKLGELKILPIAELHPFPDHPFSVKDDDAMTEMLESVKQFGVLEPGICRPRKDGGYEIIAGHRRTHACEKAEVKEMPFVVRDLDDDEAVIMLVDSNIQREDIPPSEKAKAYKMKMEALKHQGKHPERTSCQIGTKLRSDAKVAEGTGDSARTVQRYIRLTELSEPLQKMVDEKKIGMTPAVELSYLKPEEQELLLETIESEQATPSLSQAQRIRKFSQMGALNEDIMLRVMSEQKKPEREDITIRGETLRKYFPRSYTPRQMEEVILHLLDSWQKNMQKRRQQER